jgi:hypothetical protein
MADLIDSTPDPEQLAAELRELHDRREREPLAADEEARYAELWAWWQSTGGAPAGLAEAPPDANGLPGVPEEWLAAFEGEEVAPEPLPQATEAAIDAGELVREWEAWQASQSPADPFELMPDEADAGASYDDLMSARAEALGSQDTGELGGAGELDAAAFVDLPPKAIAAQEDAVELEPDAPEEPEPTLASAPTPAPPRALESVRRVVIHLADGQVRRGEVLEVELSRDTFSFIGPAGSTESVARSEVRTVFFMRAPGAPAVACEGAPIRLTLRDGRELTGRSADHESGGDGFTVVPDGARSNAALVWVARTAVRSVTKNG